MTYSIRRHSFSNGKMSCCQQQFKHADIIYVLEDGSIVESGDCVAVSRKENGRLNELRQIQGDA